MKSNLITLILSILILAGICSNTAETVAREHKPALFSSSILDLFSQEERSSFFQFLSKNEGANQFIDGFAIEPVEEPLLFLSLSELIMSVSTSSRSSPET